MSNTHGTKGFAMWAKLVLGFGVLMASLNLSAATSAPFDEVFAQRPAGAALCFKKLNFNRVDPALHLVAQVPFETESNCADIERYSGFSQRSADPARHNVDPDFGVCRFMAQDADRDYPIGLSGAGEAIIQEPVSTRSAESLTF